MLPTLPPIQAQAVQAQAANEDKLLAKNNVVGVGVGFKESNGVVTDEVAVVVLVQQKVEFSALSAEDVIPRDLDGIRTDVLEVGYLRAQENPLNAQAVTARDRFRPLIPSGVSIGHRGITAGTLGTIVKDKRTGEALILSNNHVLANSNDAMVGDAIVQPGPMDGGKDPADVVARLERFVRLRYTDETDSAPPVNTNPGGGTPPPGPNPGTGTPGTSSGCDLLSVLITLANALAAILGSQNRVTVTKPQTTAQTVPMAQTESGLSVPASSGLAVAQAVPTNTVDAALARPLDPALFVDEVRNIGIVNATKAPALGMRVRKYGRTTEYTEGTINLLNATVDIGYSTARGQKTARFTGQVIATAMSQGGDSGSLVVDAAEQKAVGLLFAGSTQATIFTPIDLVLNALDIVI
ncbi:MAG: hypothetical protein SF162_14215 [bacterium]|nr:hypothetical protein [bacterium]